MKRTQHCRNEAGKWAKSGGTIDFGETAEEAVKRETKEEIGVDIEIDHCLGWWDHLLPDEGQHWMLLQFVGHIVAGEPQNLEPEKCAQMGWFSIDNLPENCSEHMVLKGLARAREMGII